VPSTTVSISAGSNWGSAKTQVASCARMASWISATRRGPGSTASPSRIAPVASMPKRASK
jgi:hypothetical protein